MVAGAGWVSLGSLAANAASYLLHLPASRLLGPQGYGSFASLLSLQLLLAVPALAVQIVVAREVVRGRSVDSLRRTARDAAAVLVVLAAALAPLAARVLDTTVLAAAAAALTAPLLVLVSAELGVLQGRSRFHRLALALAGTGLLRVAPAVAVLTAGAGPGTTLLAGAVGTGAAVVLAHALAGAGARATEPSAAASKSRWRALAGVARASQLQLVLIALSAADLLAARALLEDTTSGLYALGAVAAKVAFWLPQAVGVVIYPALADPATRQRTLRAAVGVLTAVGVLVVLGAAVAAPLVPVLAGPAYVGVSSVLWVFALQGAALTVLQATLLSGVARDHTRVAAPAWLGLALEVGVLVVWHSSLLQVVTVAATTAVVLAVLTTTRELTRSPAQLGPSHG